MNPQSQNINKNRSKKVDVFDSIFVLSKYNNQGRRQEFKARGTEYMEHNLIKK